MPAPRRSTILRIGATGDAVRDLQHRLTDSGNPTGDDQAGTFGAGTELAVRGFQEQRGIRVDGICGHETWTALIESGYALADRMLYHRSPNQRGDDVLDLQRRLNALGFDAGREDGILGPETAAAVREFQRNAGLAVDGVAGPATVTTLLRYRAMASGGVAGVREREMLRRPRRFTGHRVFLAIAPGFEQLGTLTARGLDAAGASMLIDSSGEEDETLAARANEWHADLFVAVRAGDRRGVRCLYYESGSYRSEAGYRTARAIDAELGAVLLASTAREVCGRAYTVLRETRMAAVVCALVGEDDADGMAVLGSTADRLGAALVAGIRRGVEEAPDEEAPVTVP
ncbi:MAG TPA: peptidoglycan-binding protein [Acidimicrobiia bacterium]